MVPERLKKLRIEMERCGLDATIIPSEDAHQNEYVPACWNRRAWISGFDGSAGELVVTRSDAALWTDSRYFLQAEEQLKNTGIALMKGGLPETPSQVDWLREQLKPGARIGVDPRVFTWNRLTELGKTVKRFDLEMVSLEENLVDSVWTDQPPVSMAKVREHPMEYAGMSTLEKAGLVREKLSTIGADAYFMTTLDEIAWFFNIRGGDVAYNPVVIAYAMVTMDTSILFVDPEKINEQVGSNLSAQQVEVRPYAEAETFLDNLPPSFGRILLDAGTINARIIRLLENGPEILMGTSPIAIPKAIKNAVELAGMRKAHHRDGVAMVKFLHWLEGAVPSGSVTEIRASEKLASFRAEQERFVGPSFSTIAGYGPHGAIIHYSATPDTDVELKPEGVFLIDSGGQYLDGTTDITRTVALGPVDDRARELFTRVLKGHLALTMARFPTGTPGRQLDTIARLALWEIGEQYMHGTGHGVGAHLSVHEGPQAISYYRCTGIPMMPGMIQSNEPGFYEAGKYGFRIENLIVVIPDSDTAGRDLPFLRFEDLTLCPIDRKLIDVSLLTDRERAFLNQYHERVYRELSPFLTKEEQAWLKRETDPIV